LDRLLRSHHAVPSDVRHDFCALFLEFMALRQPPQPFWGRVMSTIQCGLRKAFPPDAKKVFQSDRDAGEKSLVSLGQLFLWYDLRASIPFVHFRRAPAE